MGCRYESPVRLAPREARGCDDEVDPVVFFVVLRDHYPLWIPSESVIVPFCYVLDCRVAKVEPQRMTAQVPAGEVAVRECPIVVAFILGQACLERAHLLCGRSSVVAYM